MPVTHPFVNPKADGADATVTRPSDWNAAHIVTGYVLAVENQVLLEDVELRLDNDIILPSDSELMWSKPADRTGLTQRMPDPMTVPNGYYWQHYDEFIAGNDHVLEGDAELMIFDRVPHSSLVLDGV